MNVIGHEKIRESLTKIVDLKQIGHAYLFVGKSGIGKKLVAIEFAKKMMCLNNINGNYCGKCEACRTFENNADFHIIEPEKNLIKVDSIREFEKEIYLKPTISNRKCFIINDADLMNESAQNALLKILEEPPEYATILLVASKKERLLNTIKSRVTTVNFNVLSLEELKKILGERADDEILKFSRGSAKDALQIMDDGYIDIATSLVKILKTKDYLAINKKINDVKADKDIRANISNILGRVILVCYKEMKDDIPLAVWLIDIIDQTNKDISRNANVDLALDSMINKICFDTK